MPDTPYCPLLSINKDVPALCQEELCMFYVKQLKLCSITVLAYTNALNLQGPKEPLSAQSTQQTSTQSSVKQNLTSPSKAGGGKSQNPFALDDLE